MEKVLVIDDFEPVRKTIKRIVEREGFIPLQASDGREGLEVFDREKPQVVITDLKMPHIDGKGVLTSIKRRSPATEVIVLTGYGDQETSNFIVKNGAFSYLNKPLDLSELVKILTAVRKKIRDSDSFKKEICVSLVSNNPKTHSHWERLLAKPGFRLHHLDFESLSIHQLVEWETDIVIADTTQASRLPQETANHLKNVEGIGLIYWGDQKSPLVKVDEDKVVEYLSPYNSDKEFVDAVREMKDLVVQLRNVLYKKSLRSSLHKISLDINDEFEFSIGPLIQEGPWVSEVYRGLSGLLPVPFIVLDEELRILALSDYLKDRLQAPPTAVNSHFFRHLGTQGIDVPDTNEFCVYLLKLLKSQNPVIEPEESEKFQRTGFLKLNLINEKRQVQKALAVIFSQKHR